MFIPATTPTALHPTPAGVGPPRYRAPGDCERAGNTGPTRGLKDVRRADQRPNRIRRQEGTGPCGQDDGRRQRHGRRPAAQPHRHERRSHDEQRQMKAVVPRLPAEREAKEQQPQHPPGKSGDGLISPEAAAAEGRRTNREDEQSVRQVARGVLAAGSHCRAGTTSRTRSFAGRSRPSPATRGSGRRLSPERRSPGPTAYAAPGPHCGPGWTPGRRRCASRSGSPRLAGVALLPRSRYRAVRS